MNRALLLAILVLASSSCYAQSPSLEQQSKMQEAFKRIFQEAQMGAGAQANGAAPVALPKVDERELASKVATMRQPGQYYVVEYRKDGFVYNGTPYIDAEGQIVRYAVDGVTGDAAYLAETSPGQGKLKWVHLSNPSETVEFGSARQGMNGWMVTTVSGKNLSGEQLVVVPTGVMVGRTSAVFVYEIGKGVRNIALPAEYVLAPLQHGSIGGTDTILLERADAGSSDNSIVNLGKTFGRLFGSTSNDYALFNMTSSAVYPLNIDASGKLTSRFSECKRKNFAVNVCDKMTSFESLFDKNGMRNMTHYYWRVNWMRTRSGHRYAVVQENGLKEINLIDLNDGRRFSVFSRGLGIAGFNAETTREGKVKITADWAFEKHVVEDVETFVQSAQPMQADALSSKSESTVGQDKLQ